METPLHLSAPTDTPPVVQTLAVQGLQQNPTWELDRNAESQAQPRFTESEHDVNRLIHAHRAGLGKTFCHSRGDKLGFYVSY